VTDRRSPFGALLIPQLRWDPGHGFAYLAEMIGESLELGVGGFLVSGGPRDAVVALTQELDRRTGVPLLVAADLEAGAGGAFDGLSGLPPLAALGALHDDEAVRRAARLTAREARTAGVNWALAPVADLDGGALNPFLGSRSFGDAPQRVAEWVVEWIDTCQSEGVLACAKHFPGVARAAADPQLGDSVVGTPAGALWAEDLLPFRAAVDTGVASVMAAHVRFPGLDPSSAVASTSRPMLAELLRDELHFEGLIVSDVLSMPGASAADGETAVAIRALGAGCDLLLAPSDPHAVVEAIEDAIEAGALSIDALEASVARRAFWAHWGRPAHGREPTLDDVLWARQVSDTVVHPVRGVLPAVGPVVDVILIDDEAEGPPGWPAPSREPLMVAMRSVGLDPRPADGPTPDGRGSVVIALFGEPRPGKGRAGYHERTRRRVARAVADARQAQRSTVVLLFGPPWLSAEVPEAPNVVCCWSGTAAMQDAAARRMA
jgi:beta-glucosidase